MKIIMIYQVWAGHLPPPCPIESFMISVEEGIQNGRPLKKTNVIKNECECKLKRLTG